MNDDPLIVDNGRDGLCDVDKSERRDRAHVFHVTPRDDELDSVSQSKAIPPLSDGVLEPCLFHEDKEKGVVDVSIVVDRVGTCEVATG